METSSLMAPLPEAKTPLPSSLSNASFSPNLPGCKGLRFPKRAGLHCAAHSARKGLVRRLVGGPTFLRGTEESLDMPRTQSRTSNSCKSSLLVLPVACSLRQEVVSSARTHTPSVQASDTLRLSLLLQWDITDLLVSVVSALLKPQNTKPRKRALMEALTSNLHSENPFADTIRARH